MFDYVPFSKYTMRVHTNPYVRTNLFSNVWYLRCPTKRVYAFKVEKFPVHKLHLCIFRFVSAIRTVIINHPNPLTPNDPYRGSSAPLTSKRRILYIYSANIGTEYFKHGVYSPFFSLQNAVCFIILTYLVPVLFTFNIQDVLK